MDYAKRLSFSLRAIIFHNRFNCVMKEFWHEKKGKNVDWICRGKEYAGKEYVGEEYERRENAE
jgi:hypothetical protein